MSKGNAHMTYCLGMLIDAGLIMMADTRTNAGVDNFSSFKKLHNLVDTRDRQLFLCSAGNLSMSQSIVSLLMEGIPSTQDVDLLQSLKEAPSMFRAAQFVGEAVQATNDKVGEALDRVGLESSVSLLLGGRIGGGPLSLFLIYNAGNFIECSCDVPFLQIGETKYGRPILDRALTRQSSIHEAVKIGLLSFDSSIQSNLAVARPIDIIVLTNAEPGASLSRRVEGSDPHFNELSLKWADGLRNLVSELPSPPWCKGAGSPESSA